MNEDIQRARERLLFKLQGDGPIQKQIILLKLTDLFENAPDFSDPERIPADSPQRRWLSVVGALLNRLDRVFKGSSFRTHMHLLNTQKNNAIRLIQGQVLDAIEELKLELELDGRDEIGNAYAPGDIYGYYADLKGIIAGAENHVFIIDPYFNGEAFDAYFSDIHEAIQIWILAERYSNDVKTYADKHVKQYGTEISLRRSTELHDRLIIIDQDDCWITGGSVKDAGKKASYLIPVQPAIAEAKLGIYSDIWERAAELD